MRNWTWLALAFLSFMAMPSLSLAAEKPLCGIATHLGQARRDMDKSFEAIKSLGADSIRDDIFWDQVERSRGVYNIPPRVDEMLQKAQVGKIKVLLVLGYGNHLYGRNTKPFGETAEQAYMNYVRYVAQTLKGRVWGYQVFNEWDWKTGGFPAGDAQDYVKFVKKASETIRSVDKDVKIISAGVTARGLKDDYLSDLMDAGVSKYVNGLAINPYVHSERRDRRTGAAVLSWLLKIRADVDKRAGKGFPLYVSEIGWPINEHNAEQDVNVYVGQLLEKVFDKELVQGWWWYGLQDNGSNKKNWEDNFGAYDENWRPKSYVKHLQQVYTLCRR